MTGLLKSYCHRGSESPLIGKTVSEHFAEVAKRFPLREAVVSVQQGRRLTYSQLASEADLMSRGLISMGFNRGDRIGIWSTNNIEWLILQLATARIGAILVNINPACRAREVSYAITRSGLNCLFTIPSFRSSNYINMLTELVPELMTSGPENIRSSLYPGLKRIVLYDPISPLRTERPAPGFTLWQDLQKKAEQIPEDRLDGITASLDIDDTINIQFTSGTTGFPKAVMLSHHNILNNAWFSARELGFTEDDRLCVTVPFYHCFGMVLANLLCLSVGACIVMPSEYFDPLAALKAIDAERCTALHGVPTMFMAELEHPEFRSFDLSSLRTGIMAGAPCQPGLVRRVMDEMGCRDILIGYGETEASPLTHLTAATDSLMLRTETVGRNLPHQEVKVIDPSNGAIVAIEKTGEICFRGYHVMKGYYSDPESTKQAIDPDGWLHSGDLGSMDEEGYLRITGRLKEMIIRGGENIYPREIEDYIFTHPKVAEVAVFGVPDDYYGEEVMAWIRLHAGLSATSDEISEYCRGKLAHFKIPKYIWFVEGFPMTVTGKIQKFRMRES